MNLTSRTMKPLRPTSETLPPLADDALVLGIDPGTRVTGIGFVRRFGSRFEVVDYGAWRARDGMTRAERLGDLSRHVEQLCQTRTPAAVALEQAFIGRNIQSALRLGEARGAILAACARCDVTVVEYPTATVKKAIVGNGRAAKEQVQFMLQRLLNLSEPPRPLDASDALALAFTLLTDPGLRMNVVTPRARSRRR